MDTSGHSELVSTNNVTVREEDGDDNDDAWLHSQLVKIEFRLVVATTCGRRRRLLRATMHP